MRKSKPISPFEFVLICVIIAVTALAGLQVISSRLVNRSSAAAQPFIAQFIPSATAIATETPRPTVTPLGKTLPTQNLPNTWTPTSTWTPLPTRTNTPTNTPTPTATSKPPLPGLRPTVTPAFDIVLFNYSTEITQTIRPTPVPLVDLPQNTINIVLLGSDRRHGTLGWRTDDHRRQRQSRSSAVNMFSIPRDTGLHSQLALHAHQPGGFAR
jgi:hypothetical protein